jgi:steroid 5-alpha reductase family enzyme
MNGKSIKSLVTVFVAAAAGLVFGWLAGTDSLRVAGMTVFFLCTLVALAVNWLAFIPAAAAQTEKYYDLTGSITYTAMIITALVLASPHDIRALVVAGMVLVWTGRLGIFLFRRISDAGGDSRFDKIKTHPSRFLVAWTLQALWGIFTAAAAIAIITAKDPELIGAFFWIGASLWLIGFVIEIIADGQKSAFRKDKANDGEFISSGLWAWSQHPNYFGEILLWTGIAVMALPLLSGWSWLVLVSPVFVYVLLTGVSGIPMLDAKAEKRWGMRKDFRRYRAQTPKLILMPPKAQ